MTEPLTPLHLRVVANSGAARMIRHGARDWLRELGACDDDVNALEHAINELVQNAVDHAYSTGTDGDVTATLRLDHSGDVVVTICDGGRWRAEPPKSHRGLGLAMVRSLVDHLDVDTDHGTTATVRHRVATSGPRAVSRRSAGRAP